MRKTTNTGRRANKHRGCSTGIFKFIIFLVSIICLGIAMIRIYLESDLATKIKMIQYPIKYENFVEKYAQEYDLDKYLIYSVIREESRFDRYAVSSADAKGLMQLTEKTGEYCANQLKINDYTKDSLFDPEVNINLGCFYLKSLIDRYDDINIALAAYNGGPGNVDSWLSDKKYVDKKGNLVNIPFRETRNYIGRVNEAKSMYESIYANIE